ncbi:hypothetical protein BJF90_08210 [Pseudonocardia sp. CNS-004]|nr:hypothetical protein BJF90_08210 [Pseudonocardia sp. CNS-004]
MSTSSIGATQPICAYVGSRPVTRVAADITMTLRTKSRFRPTRSATRAMRIPAMGLIKKPTA